MLLKIRCVLPQDLNVRAGFSDLRNLRKNLKERAGMTSEEIRSLPEAEYRRMRDRLQYHMESVLSNLALQTRKWYYKSSFDNRYFKAKKGESGSR